MCQQHLFCLAVQRAPDLCYLLVLSSCSYDRDIADANRKLDEAQATVNSLWGAYNYWNSKCDWWIGNWGNCVEAGANWLAYQLANAGLEAARGFLNKVANGIVYWTLSEARNTLNVAQTTADQVLQGTLAIARETTFGTLEAARKAANDILTGSEKATLDLAQATLTSTRQTAQDILTGTHYLALTAAQGTLAAAQDTVKAAEVVATGTLNAVQTSLNEVGGALTKVKTAGFIQFNSLTLALTARTDRFAAGVSYDLTIGGKSFKGSLVLDVSNPMELLLNLIKNAVLGVVRTETPAIAPMIPAPGL